MIRTRLLPLVALLVVVAAGCNWPNTPPPGAAPVRFRDPVFNAVTVTSNVSYGSAVNGSSQTIDLKTDLYQPTGDTSTSRPAIIWVHGGSFCCGTKTSAELVDQANVFAKAGYFNASIDYRLESPGCSGNRSNCILAIQEATADAQTAVRYFRTNAATYGIDPDRIAIAGSSAGAITALNVAYSTSEDTSGAGVRSAVGISGAQLVSGSISRGDAAVLDFHCTTDPLVAYSWAQNTISSAQALGLPAYLTSWDETCHVPYAAHKQQILDQTTNFLWWSMDLAHASV
ncbi:MAG: alpha/beta hydrolase [Acidimicrobiia bacterium]|nr:alpha/beta hydrolase [Acidimicrobiia bacterium]